MSETDNGTKTTNEVKAPRHHWGIRLFRYIKSKFHQRRTKKKHENPADRAARRTATATVWMAVFTVVLATVSGLTLLVLKNQLQEMHDGGVDTHNLATAAGDQATWTKNLATSAGTQSDRTKDLADRMKDQADRTRDLADQATIRAQASKQLARNAADTLANTKQSFSDEQRAWIGVQGTSDIKGFTPTEPWGITIVFFNSGRSPARNVQVSGMYITSRTPLAGPSHQEVTRLTFRPAQSIAPQGNYREVMGTAIGAELSTNEEIFGQSVLTAQYTQIKNKQLFLYYYGLIKYSDAFGRPHDTQFCVLLANPDTKEAGMCDSFNDLH